MTEPSLTVAALQLPVSADIAANRDHIARALAEAKAAGAGLLLTPEGALSGYAGVDFESFVGFSWPALREAVASLQHAAAQHGLWLILGAAHCLEEARSLEDGWRPTNALYVIAPSGDIVDRYDKCQLTDSDMLHFTAGDHRVVLDVGGQRVGLLVCYDICYPEMYAAYRDDGVGLMLHAFHNAGFGGENILDEVKPAWLRARAADNQMWIVAANSSRPHSSWGNKVVRPDGSVAAELAANQPGILVHRFPDPSLKGWLHNFTPLRLAEDTVFHRGSTSEHPRYRDRRAGP